MKNLACYLGIHSFRPCAVKALEVGLWVVTVCTGCGLFKGTVIKLPDDWSAEVKQKMMQSLIEREWKA